MNLLFIIDPPDSLKAYKDTTVAMMRAAEARGHAVHVCEQPGLAWHDGSVGAQARRLRMTDNDEDWYRGDGHAQRSLASFDAVLMRKDPPFDLEYVTSTWLLSAAVREGARVFNAPGAIRDHNEKLAIAEFPRFVAPTLVAREPQRLHAFIDAQRDVVLKRLDVMGGENIFRVRADDPNRNVIVEIMAANTARSVMAQRYIPEIGEGDKRILLIGGLVTVRRLRLARPAGFEPTTLGFGGQYSDPLSYGRFQVKIIPLSPAPGHAYERARRAFLLHQDAEEAGGERQGEVTSRAPVRGAPTA